MEIDLDAARAARAEKSGEEKFLVVNGQKFEMPVECPYEVAELLSLRHTSAALTSLFGEEMWLKIKNGPPRFSVRDAKFLVEQIADFYGFGSAGESSASGNSSKKGGKRSRPTSAASTKLTSVAPALDQKP